MHCKIVYPWFGLDISSNNNNITVVCTQFNNYIEVSSKRKVYI